MKTEYDQFKNIKWFKITLKCSKELLLLIRIKNYWDEKRRKVTKVNKQVA